ncbi:MAG: methylenetetrahydrofolate reductase C-terminal domain-containing protein [Verrucomicrobiota bacterium]|nr:methylenetetrahydrofolate reductase C-terminal domain-containing protein [Verrucomicrobiota bacterium]
MPQININFNTKNPFSAKLRTAEFTLAVENWPGEKTQPADLSRKQILDAAVKVKNQDYVSAITVADRITSLNAYSPVETATEIFEKSEKMPIVCISGKNSSKNRVLSLLRQAETLNLKNILAVTGDLYVSKKKGAALKYMDSVDIISIAKEFNSNIFAGAVVNPFKYNAPDLYSQYFKLVKKIHAGADFIVTQAGWDMGKFQELQWFLAMREINVPVIARLYMPSSEKIDNLDIEIFPGVSISKIYASTLQREKKINYQQAVATHLRRISLMAAGCHLMGYSGIQIVGIEDTQLIEMTLKRISETVENNISWKDWLQEWNDFHNNTRIAPENHNYYIFKNLLQAEFQTYSQKNAEVQKADILSPSFVDRIKYSIGKIFGLDKFPTITYPLKAIIYGCLFCNNCSLKENFYICGKECPKGLASGPCGGTNLNGNCENGKNLCLFHKKYILATWNKEIYKLESQNE